MKTQFDKIYVLSLISNHKRRKFIERQFKDLGIDFEFIYGTDFYNIQYDGLLNKIQYPNVWANGCWNENKTDFSRDFGCTISHYNAVLYAYELGYKSVLVIEDDVCFIKNKKILYDCLNEIPKDADYVTYDPRFTWEGDFFEFKKIIDQNSLFSYMTNRFDKTMVGGMLYGIMNKETMEIYLNNQRNQLTISDQIKEFNIDNKNVKKYVCNKCICTDHLNIKTNFKQKIAYTYYNIYNFINPLDRNMFYIPDDVDLFTREVD